MSKEYRYRKHVRWAQYVLPVAFGLMILFFAFIFGKLILVAPPDFVAFPIVMLIVLSLIILVEGGIGWYAVYRLAGVVVSIDNDGVVYKYRGGVKRLPFENLRIESSSIRYTGGWMKLVSGRDVIRLTVVLENIGEFIQELKIALDDRGLSSHYDSQKLFSFMKTAAYSDQSWERLYVVAGKLYLIIPVIAITIANGYIFGTSGWAGLFGAVGWGIFSIFWATGAYTIAEIKLGRKIAKESSGQSFTFPQRDLAYEKYVFNQAIKWGGWLYFGISLLVFVGILAIKLLLFVPR